MAMQIGKRSQLFEQQQVNTENVSSVETFHVFYEEHKANDLQSLFMSCIKKMYHAMYHETSPLLQQNNRSKKESPLT